MSTNPILRSFLILFCVLAPGGFVLFNFCVLAMICGLEGICCSSLVPVASSSSAGEIHGRGSPVFGLRRADPRAVRRAARGRGFGRYRNPFPEGDVRTRTLTAEALFEVRQLLRDRLARGNMDATIIAQAPRMARLSRRWPTLPRLLRRPEAVSIKRYHGEARFMGAAKASRSSRVLLTGPHENSPRGAKKYRLEPHPTPARQGAR